MMNIELGERVRIKNREDWPTPPGYRLANATGIVVGRHPAGFVEVELDNSAPMIDVTRVLTFPGEQIEKI